LKGLLVPVAIGTVAVVVFAVTARTFAMGKRLRENGQYLVSVRYPGQWYDIRSFVQPDNPDVVAVYSKVGPDPWALYDWVCRNINYRRDIGEFWAFPSEVLARGTADCEDTSNLLTSLLLYGGNNAYTVLGEYQGYGHAWCEHNGQILESTYTSARPVADPTAYKPMVIFNDVQVVELYPGALGEVFALRRNEEFKLNLMAKALEALP
ncbi:unnamed protein product, partial [marine sediment metagenome]